GVMSLKRIPGLGKSGTSRMIRLSFSSKFVPFDASVNDEILALAACGFLLDLHSVDAGAGRPRAQGTLQRLECFGAPLGDRFHAAVGKVPDLAPDPQAARRPAGEVPVPDTLDSSFDPISTNRHGREVSNGRGEWI